MFGGGGGGCDISLWHMGKFDVFVKKFWTFWEYLETGHKIITFALNSSVSSIPSLFPQNFYCFYSSLGWHSTQITLCFLHCEQRSLMSQRKTWGHDKCLLAGYTLLTTLIAAKGSSIALLMHVSKMWESSIFVKNINKYLCFQGGMGVDLKRNVPLTFLVGKIVLWAGSQQAFGNGGGTSDRWRHEPSRGSRDMLPQKIKKISLSENIFPWVLNAIWNKIKVSKTSKRFSFFLRLAAICWMWRMFFHIKLYHYSL